MGFVQEENFSSVHLLPTSKTVSDARNGVSLWVRDKCLAYKDFYLVRLFPKIL